ncbi:MULTISPECIES: hypothetical protein [unclassified Saccharibacter]|uniref:hypothetical protein n=1 Tax=unclassified Saccharibacter TaxID=2648722 RepID=UPI001329898F|nr:MULTISPECIES: hypothetical protein [unclassified Saccharibacter]MXV35820.1 hypothetical protein [Saccharibacter sp. EH611]MXV57941.1 hypothetical protein [Saccharibacter sp. EH70]MXV66336.1 hypothetical protein [Saccharibacter sp. EH60]
MTSLVPVPVEIRFLADVVGEAVTFAFVEAHAGQKLWVPRVRVDTSNLARSWGVDVARCLSEHFGGEKYQVPMLKAWRVRRLALMGYSYNDIVVRVGVSHATLHNFLFTLQDAVRAARIVPDERQLSLF